MRAFVALVGLATLVLGAPCAAQTRNSHEVRVSVPTVLRLRVDDGETGSVATVPVSIRVASGVARFQPDRSRIRVLANTRWQLSTSFAPAKGSESLELTYALAGGVVLWQASDFAPVVLNGDATCGWREESVQYGLARVPSDGAYGGVITFTLARP
jgi:hypothetical protein